MIKVAAFTGGRNVPSARFRVRQYQPLLGDVGISVDEMALATSAYPPARQWQRPIWAAARLTELAAAAARSRRYDLTWLQREMLSTRATLEGWTGRPRMFDVDDSIHLLGDGRFAAAIAARCDLVIAGNAWLADWYSNANSRVEILPTPVDASRYRPAARTGDGPVVVGWIGTGANLPFLEAIEAGLAAALERNPALRLAVVSNIAPSFRSIAADRWSFRPWSEAREIVDIQSFDIGLMPLRDDDWARGKCSFKMIQYMACGLPVVVSPVGMNREVMARGEVGFGADSVDDWADALSTLAADAGMRGRMGATGRGVVERDYSVEALAPRLAKLIGGLVA